MEMEIGSFLSHPVPQPGRYIRLSLSLSPPILLFPPPFFSFPLSPPPSGRIRRPVTRCSRVCLLSSVWGEGSPLSLHRSGYRCHLNKWGWEWRGDLSLEEIKYGVVVASSYVRVCLLRSRRRMLAKCALNDIYTWLGIIGFCEM